MSHITGDTNQTTCHHNSLYTNDEALLCIHCITYPSTSYNNALCHIVLTVYDTIPLTLNENLLARPKFDKKQ